MLLETHKDYTPLKEVDGLRAMVELMACASLPHSRSLVGTVKVVGRPPMALVGSEPDGPYLSIPATQRR